MLLEVHTSCSKVNVLLDDAARRRENKGGSEPRGEGGEREGERGCGSACLLGGSRPYAGVDARDVDLREGGREEEWWRGARCERVSSCRRRSGGVG